MRSADLTEVVPGDPGVPDVVGLDGDHGPAAAVLEAVGPVRHHPPVEPALAQDLLQAVEQLLATLLGARPLRVARGAGVHADENLSLGLRHGAPPHRV